MISIGLAAKVLFSGLKKIPWQAYACAGVILIGWMYGNYRANQVQTRWDESVARGKELVDKLKKQQVIINTKIETKYVNRIKTVYVKGDTIEKEIPVFIPHYNDLLPGGFRLLHDAAATNTVPDRTLIAFAAPTTVGDASSTIIRNYTSCQAIREVALGWQEWYREQRALTLPEKSQKASRNVDR